MSPHRRLGGAVLGLCVLLLALALALGSGAAAGSSPRIVGGGKANPAGWQFAVALTQRRRFICSGSLIAPTKVLTAAHCVKTGKRRQLSVLAGSPWITPKRRRPRIKVTAVAIDPAYNGRKGSHDFSVLTLASAPDAQPIALATRVGDQGGHQARKHRPLGGLGHPQRLGLQRRPPAEDDQGADLPGPQVRPRVRQVHRLPGSLDDLRAGQAHPPDSQPPPVSHHLVRGRQRRPAGGGHAGRSPSDRSRQRGRLPVRPVRSQHLRAGRRPAWVHRAGD